MQTRPTEPGIGACKTQIEVDGTRGLIRYVTEGESVREIWDVNGDGTPEGQLRKTYDAEGRLVAVESLAPDGMVLERVRRSYDGDRLTVEETNRWTDEGLPGPGGAIDWRRELIWKDGQLLEERIDELGPDDLPGTDGKPEFVTTWTIEDGRRTRGSRAHRDGTIVATYALDWKGDRLVGEAIDYGADGTVDRTIRYDWSGDVVTLVETKGATGTTVVRHDYCR